MLKLYSRVIFFKCQQISNRLLLNSSTFSKVLAEAGIDDRIQSTIRIGEKRCDILETVVPAGELDTE